MAHIDDLDLSALQMLQVLLETHSVSAAARRLGRTQPAVSKELSRLRDVLGDPLFVRTGATLEPTARALAIEQPVRELLAIAEALLRPAGEVDTARLSRCFRIGASDYGELAVIPGLIPLLAGTPGVSIQTMFFGDDVDRRLQSGELDVAIAARFAPLPGLVQQKLLEDRNVCVVAKGHRLAERPLTIDDFAECPHVAASPRGRTESFVDEALAAHQRKRRVLVYSPHFLTVMQLAATSDLLAVVPERLARIGERTLGLVVREPPLELARFYLHMSYREVARADPELSWLRDQLLGCVTAHPAPVPARRRTPGRDRVRR